MDASLIRTWRVGASTFRAVPEAGARLMDWHIAIGHSASREVIYWPERETGASFAKVRGGNPILFPFAGQSWQGQLSDHWQAPNDAVLPISQHGFARQGRFQVVHEDHAGFIAELQPDEAAHRSYPFEFCFRVAYRFEELSLTVDLSLENRSRACIPWAAGHHFYFRVPWHTGFGREDYRLIIPSAHLFRLGEHGSLIRDNASMQRRPDAGTFPLNHAVNPAVFMRLKSSEIRLGPRGNEEDIAISIGAGGRPSPNYALVAWTESDASPFFCVEPWMGPPNAPGNGKMSWVDPGHTDVFSVRVALV